MSINSQKHIHKVSWPSSKTLAFTTTRLFPGKHSSLGSVIGSKAPFDEFNLGLHVGDDADNVRVNRHVLKHFLGAHQHIQWLDQVHGSDVVLVDRCQESPIVADAVITKNRAIALAIMTADCLPILLANRDGTEVAAIHAGWRPLAANIIDKTIKQMASKPFEIMAWLGPCIGPLAFEVGSEVKHHFSVLDVYTENMFKAYRDNKFLADIRGIAEHFLKLAGVTDIQSLSHCTFSQSDEYYSYRRDEKTGRMASIIAIGVDD